MALVEAAGTLDQRLAPSDELRAAILAMRSPVTRLPAAWGVKAPYVASLEAGTQPLGWLGNIADALGRGLDITFPEVQAESRR